MTQPDHQRALTNLTLTIEHLEDMYSESRTPVDQRSVDYEFGNLDLTVGDLKALRDALDLHDRRVTELLDTLKLVMKNSANFKLKAPRYMVELVESTLERYAEMTGG